MRWIIAIIVAMCVAHSRAGAVNWSATDVSGAKVAVPAVDRVSVIAFVRADQPQSDRALEQVRALTKDDKVFQVIVVFGGEKAVEHAKARAQAKDNPPWPLVVDRDFAASGKLNVHVWPTTVVVDRSGNEVAHLAGVPASFASNLAAHLDFALAKIDAAELKQRLSNHDIVTDDPRQAAARHLLIARRLLDSGQLDQARSQIDQGLKLQPDDKALSLALARVLVFQGKASESIQMLDRLSPDAAPASQLAVLRARALIALDRWDDAKTAMTDALKLNPEPAEAYYVMGLIHQHDTDWPQAAESFRKAYESAARVQRPATTSAPSLQGR